MNDEPKPEDLQLLSNLEWQVRDAAAIVLKPALDSVAQVVEETEVTDEASANIITRAARQCATWADEITAFWTPHKEWYYRRYKAIHAVISTGATVNGFTITGTGRLGEIRKAAEARLKLWRDQEKARIGRMQELIDAAALRDVTALREQAERLMAQGDMAGARAVREEISRQAVPVVMQAPVRLEGAQVREPFSWKVDSLMAVIQAVADGTVALNHNVTVRGKEDNRPLLIVDPVVLNQLVRKLGTEINIPGISVATETEFTLQRVG
jgi:hypothetical protein